MAVRSNGVQSQDASDDPFGDPDLEAFTRKKAERVATIWGGVIGGVAAVVVWGLVSLAGRACGTSAPAPAVSAGPVASTPGSVHAPEPPVAAASATASSIPASAPASPASTVRPSQPLPARTAEAAATQPPRSQPQPTGTVPTPGKSKPVIAPPKGKETF